jgi:ABC-2 type transport system permease protein
MPEWAVGVLGVLSAQGHFYNIARGVLDSRDILYFLSITIFCLVWATRSIEARKWKE